MQGRRISRNSHVAVDTAATRLRVKASHFRIPVLVNPKIIKHRGISFIRIISELQLDNQIRYDRDFKNTLAFINSRVCDDGNQGIVTNFVIPSINQETVQKPVQKITLLCNLRNLIYTINLIKEILRGKYGSR